MTEKKHLAALSEAPVVVADRKDDSWFEQVGIETEVFAAIAATDCILIIFAWCSVASIAASS